MQSPVITRHFFDGVEVATLKSYAERVDRSHSFLRYWAKRSALTLPEPLVEVPTADGRTVKYYGVDALDSWVSSILTDSAGRIARGVGRPRKS